MNYDDRAGPASYCRFDLRFVYIQRVLADINEDWPRSA
jgi:hypothetical protein